MHHHLIEVIASIIIAGAVLQWVGWKLQIPGLILLILAGVLLGPAGIGWLNPEQDFGEMLQPMISLGVAVIVFEGGLNLRWHEFKQNSKVIYRLVTWSVLITFVLSVWQPAICGHGLAGGVDPGSDRRQGLGRPIMPAAETGQSQTPSGRPATLEGIVNDLTGALLAVLIYGYYMYTDTHTLAGGLRWAWARGIAVSLLLGLGAGLLVGAAFRRGYVPEHLKSPLILAMVLLVYPGQQGAGRGRSAGCHPAWYRAGQSAPAHPA
ncbi:MAG: cation:proton antiporter [Thiolinea sp.]